MKLVNKEKKIGRIKEIWKIKKLPFQLLFGAKNENKGKQNYLNLCAPDVCFVSRRLSFFKYRRFGI